RTVRALVENNGTGAAAAPALLRRIPEPQADATAPAITDFLAGPFAHPRARYARLHRIAVLVSTLRLSSAELRYFAAHAADFAGFDLSRYHETPYRDGFAHWQRLVTYAALRDRLTPDTAKLVDVFAEPAAS